MSRFVNGETVRVELGGGDWAELRTSLGYGARQAIQAKLLGRQAVDVAEGKAKAAELMPDFEAGNVELLLRAIVAWGGPGFCEAAVHPHDGPCTVRGITAENVAQLDATGDRLLAELEQRMAPARTPDFTKPLSPSSRTAARAGRHKGGSRTSR